ncbi:hypothetical protein, partial [Enterobacter kobei]|uniref:hypothetical protein n=1 Tax=Enterobacter kobei TaxID=208224 RepID=UPI00317BED76
NNCRCFGRITKEEVNIDGRIRNMGRGKGKRDMVAGDGASYKKAGFVFFDQESKGDGDGGRSGGLGDM